MRVRLGRSIGDSPPWNNDAMGERLRPKGFLGVCWGGSSGTFSYRTRYWFQSFPVIQMDSFVQKRLHRSMCNDWIQDPRRKDAPDTRSGWHWSSRAWSLTVALTEDDGGCLPIDPRPSHRTCSQLGRPQGWQLVWHKVWKDSMAKWLNNRAYTTHQSNA